MTKYTIYLVSRSATDHYTRIMANNGKPTLNESVRRVATLVEGVRRFLTAIRLDQYEVVKVTHTEFKKKFPKYARNAGPKRKAK